MPVIWSVIAFPQVLGEQRLVLPAGICWCRGSKISKKMLRSSIHLPVNIYWAPVSFTSGAGCWGRVLCLLPMTEGQG